MSFSCSALDLYLNTAEVASVYWHSGINSVQKRASVPQHAIHKKNISGIIRGNPQSRLSMRTVAISTLLLFCFLSASMFSVYLYRENRQAFVDYSITLPVLVGPGQEFNMAQIRNSGRPFVINVFASWCTTCSEEHVTWKTIAEDPDIDLYGIAYVDVEHSTLSWLEKHGNPYRVVAADYSGQTAKVLGVTGVPETFVFDATGALLLRITGIVTLDMWKKRIAGLLSEHHTQVSITN